MKTKRPSQETSSAASRRSFLKTSAVVAGSLTTALAWSGRVHAAGSDRINVGLIGCGGRGTGAASQALRAHPNNHLVAMADAFEDRLESSLSSLRLQDVGARVEVPRERRFVGFDAYKQVIESSDVVLLCTPPHFRPMHLRAAVDAGKHVFAEKPVAVDAPGVRSVLETCEEARKKKLSIVSGLCIRYDNGFRETVSRLQDGQAGEIHTLQANDFRGSIWVKPREPHWTDMEWQMRNWYYFTWLSGDFNVEQHVHFLDVCSWIMGDQYPVSAMGLGGRQVRSGPEYGHIYDHFSVIYQYDNGAQLFSYCRQQPGCDNDISGRVFGSRGSAFLSEGPRGLSIETADDRWSYDGPKNEMYQEEHNQLFSSIRDSQPINNGEYMAKSTLLAILGRMAAYTGKQITWEMAMNSKEDLTPPAYDWNVPLTVPPVAMPGITDFS